VPAPRRKPTEAGYTWPASTRVYDETPTTVAHCIECEWARAGANVNSSAAGHAVHFNHHVMLERIDRVHVTRNPEWKRGDPK